MPRMPPTTSRQEHSPSASAAFEAFTPPVGINAAFGNGPLSAFKYLGPPRFPAGKILISLASCSSAVINSVGVIAPGMASLRHASAVVSTEVANPGLTRNSAPASTHIFAWSALVTVPAPVKTRSPYSRTTCRMRAGASGTVMVISTMGIPPSQFASTARLASCALDARTTGMTPTSPILRITSSIVIRTPGPGISSTCDTRRLRFHHLQDFAECCHRCVARGCHRERAVCRPALHGPLRLVARKKAINQAGSKRIASTHAVIDLKIFPHARFVEVSAVETYGAPVVHGCGFRMPQGGRDDGQVRKILNNIFDHGFKICGIELGMTFIQSRHRKSQSCREIFLVT